MILKTKKSFNKLVKVFSIIVFTLVISGALPKSSDAKSNGPSQDNAATAIGIACEGLILSISRNPSLDDQLLSIYNSTVAEILSMSHDSSNRDLSVAKAIIARARIQAVARNPALKDDFEELAAMCEEDINSL